MRRSSVILLWTSFCLSLVGSIIQVVSTAIVHSRLHHAVITAVADPDGRLPQNPNTFEVHSRDFMAGTVIHISPNIFLTVLPIATWVTVWIRDRAALKTPTGVRATWAGAVYLAVTVGTIVYLESFLTR